MAKNKKELNRPAPPPGFLKRNKLYILLFLIAFVAFANAVPNGYALDDEFYTAGANKLTQKGVSGIKEIFTTRTFYNTDGSGYSYRPVALTSFALEIEFFGEKPAISHLINVILYALTVVLLFAVLRKWLQKQSEWFSFVICALFAVHPLHTEVVANIKCRDELLSFFFGLLTIYFVWKQIETGAWWTWAGICISFVLGALSKTTIAPLVAIIPFAVWYFTEKKWWQSLIYLAPMIAGVILVRILLLSQLPEMSRTYQGFENPLVGMEFAQKLATAFYVLGRYLWLHFIPYPLIFYYGYNEVPVAEWSMISVLLSVVVYAGLVVLSWIEFRKRSVAGFGLIFFLGNIILYSNLLGAAPGLMAERFTYAASLGFCIAVIAYLFRYFKVDPAQFKWDWKRKTGTGLQWTLTIVFVVFSFRTWSRNEDWENKEVLYRNDVELAPESAKINMLLGSLLSAQAAQQKFEASQMAQQGNQREAQELMRNATSLFMEAREYYNVAKEIFPSYHTAWSNLGTTYYFLEDFKGGIPYFKEAVRLNPDYAEGYFNLGMSYEQLYKSNANLSYLDSSIYFFSTGLEGDPKYVNSADQLSRILIQHKHDTAAAMSLLNECIKNNPASDLPLNSLSSVYLQKKDTAKAVELLEKAAAINPGNVNRLKNLERYFSMKGNAGKASYYNRLYNEQLQLQNNQKRENKRKRKR